MSGPFAITRGLRATWVLFWRHSRLLLRSRRSVFMLFLLCVPLVPVFAMRVMVYFDKGPGLWQTQALRFFNIMASVGYLNFMVVLLSLFWATPLFTEEVKGGSARFLFLCPAPRAALPLAKFLAFVLVSGLALGASLFACFYLLGSGPAYPMWIDNLHRFYVDWGLLVLALAAYGAFFALLGLWLRHPLLWGLFFAFIWDTGAQVLPGSTHLLTLRHYFRSLFPDYLEGENMFPLLLFEQEVSAHVTAYIVLGTFIVLVLALAMIHVHGVDAVAGETD